MLKLEIMIKYRFPSVITVQDNTMLKRINKYSRLRRRLITVQDNTMLKLLQ